LDIKLIIKGCVHRLLGGRGIIPLVEKKKVDRQRKNSGRRPQLFHVSVEFFFETEHPQPLHQSMHTALY
jgi:hypothetical protein